MVRFLPVRTCGRRLVRVGGHYYLTKIPSYGRKRESAKKQGRPTDTINDRETSPDLESEPRSSRTGVGITEMTRRRSRIFIIEENFKNYGPGESQEEIYRKSSIKNLVI